MDFWIAWWGMLLTDNEKLMELILEELEDE